MLTPGNVVKVYKKEVLDNLVSGWNKEYQNTENVLFGFDS